MYWISIGLIFIAALNLILASVVLLRNPRNKINIYFSLSLASAALWGATEGLLFLSKTLSSVLLSAELSYIFGAFAGANLLLFSFYFPFENYKVRWKHIFIIYFSFFIVVLVSFAPGLLVSKVVLSANYNDARVNPTGFWIYFIIFIFYFIWAFYNLFSKYLNGGEMARRQSKYLIYGILIATIFAVIFDLLIPYFKGEILGWVGPYFTLLISFGVAYLLFFGEGKMKVD